MAGGAASGRAVVVGAGVVGVATALALRRDGWAVTLIDPHPPGEAGASFGNAGLIATHIVRPLAMPGIARQVPRMLLDPTGPLKVRWHYLPRLAPWLWRFVRAARPEVVERLTAALASMLEPSFDAWRALLEEAGASDLLRQDGNVMVYRTEDALAAAAWERHLLVRHGVRLEVVGDNALRELLPPLDRAYRHGVHFPDSGHVRDPLRVTQAVALLFERHGGRIVRARAEGFRTNSGSVQAVRTDRGEEAGDLFVVTAGIWSRALCRRLGVRLPLDTERGYHVMLPTPGVELPRPMILGDLKFAVTPMAGGLRMAGTIEFGGIEAPPDPRRHRMMLDRAPSFLPGVDTSGASSWMGFRPSFPDSLPVIDRAPGWDNAYLAFGHGHLGLTAGAVTGQAVADLAAGRTPPFDLAPFAATRFG
jgi:glycine/D-amino acid oxidase-like deaminating enzyme